MNEIRNELLLILKIEKETDKKDREFEVKYLLERFEYDIKDQLKNLEYKKQELEENLQTLEYVRKELF